MSTDRRALEHQRGELLQSLVQLQGFRPGKVLVHRRKCGKASCHCAEAGDAGHEPQFFWVYSKDGKPRTVTLTSPEQVKQYQEQTERYARFQQLTKRLVEVETALSECEEESTPLSASEWGALKKKLLQRSKRAQIRRGK